MRIPMLVVHLLRTYSDFRKMKAETLRTVQVDHHMLQVCCWCLAYTGLAMQLTWGSRLCRYESEERRAHSAEIVRYRTIETLLPLNVVM